MGNTNVEMRTIVVLVSAFGVNMPERFLTLSPYIPKLCNFGTPF